MNFLSTLKQNHLREQRIQFIRAHLDAFDVEPIFPLGLFEEFVASIEGDCIIEASCKIEVDRLIASRFLFFFVENSSIDPMAETLGFFERVEKHVSVQINYDLLQQFLSRNYNSDTAKLLSCGLDLRSILDESSLKMHFRLDDSRPDQLGIVFELIETAIALADLDAYSLDLLHTFSQVIPKHKLIPQVGFDFYLNGSSEIELYLEITEEYFQQPEIQNLLQQRFPDDVLAPLEGAYVLHIGLSQVNLNPVIYYQLKQKRDFSIYFRVNSTAERVQSFYQPQVRLLPMWVGVAEQELKKSKIENIRVYYHKWFGNKNHPSNLNQ